MPQLFGLARLGRDAELRYATGGEPVCNLSLAFSYGRKGDDGKRPTQWIDATLWGKLAESIAPYLLKGGQVAVTLDDVHIETFKRSDGSPGHKMAGRVSQIELGSRPEGADKSAAPPPAAAPKPAASKPATGFDDMDSDIPF